VPDNARGPERQPAQGGSGRHAVFTFETPHQAVAAEAVLRRARVAAEEVPPPERAEAGCGVALRIGLGALYEAIGALATEDAGWQAVYELGERQEVIARLG
jgi:hypothetical protein